MYKFVFFDLDDTLLDFGACERAALRNALKENGVDMTPEMNARYSAINDSKWKLFERGEIDQPTVQLSRFADFFAEFDLPLIPEEFNKCYRHQLSLQAVVYPDAEPILQKLAPKYQLYLASNGISSVQHSRVTIAGLEKYFLIQFNSGEIGVQKPNRAFFEASFAQIPDFDPKQAIIIGDSLSSDMQGGLNAGIATCWYNPKHKSKPDTMVLDYEIDRLEQLFEILPV